MDTVSTNSSSLTSKPEQDQHEFNPKLFCANANIYFKIIMLLCKMLKKQINHENISLMECSGTENQQNIETDCVENSNLIHIDNSNYKSFIQVGTPSFEDSYNGKSITLYGASTILKFIATKYGNGTNLYPVELDKRYLIDDRLWFATNKLVKRIEVYLKKVGLFYFALYVKFSLRVKQIHYTYDSHNTQHPMHKTGTFVMNTVLRLSS